MRAKDRQRPVSSSGLEQPIEYYESGPDSSDAVTEKQPWPGEEARAVPVEESHVTLRSDRMTRVQPSESNKMREGLGVPSSAARIEAFVSERGRAPLEPISRPRPDTVSAAGTQRVKGDRRQAPFAPSSIALEPKKKKAA